MPYNTSISCKQHLVRCLKGAIRSVYTNSDISQLVIWILTLVQLLNIASVWHGLVISSFCHCHISLSCLKSDLFLNLDLSVQADMFKCYKLWGHPHVLPLLAQNFATNFMTGGSYFFCSEIFANIKQYLWLAILNCNVPVFLYLVIVLRPKRLQRYTNGFSSKDI